MPSLGTNVPCIWSIERADNGQLQHVVVSIDDLSYVE